MFRSFEVIRRLGLAAKGNSLARRIVVPFSRARAGLRGGGLVYVQTLSILDPILRELGHTPRASLPDYVAEVRSNEPLRETFVMESERRGFPKDKSWTDRVDRLTANIVLYYALVRELRPAIVVETGTATGSMTSLLLAALHANQHGRLISIDLPAVTGMLTMDIDVPESDVGYWIPPRYKDRWDYRKGDAKLLLPRVLAEERADFFVHDSLHTRSHMAFEYGVARALMPEKAIIMSDDILWNDGFDAFASLHRLIAYAPLGNPNIGILVNRFDKFERATGLGIVPA